MLNVNLRKILGEQIRKQRKKLGYNQYDLASEVDSNRTYIGVIERGEVSPTIDTLFNICQALNMQLSDLMRDTERAIDDQS